MGQNENIEYFLFKCPIADPHDHETYPLVKNEEIRRLENRPWEDKQQALFIYYFTTKNEIKFVDIYIRIWKKGPEIVRFIIRSGYRMPKKAEDDFLKITKQYRISIARHMLRMLREFIEMDYPEWNYPGYTGYQMGMALQHMYFASHRSGPKETLYKAGLSYTAFHLDQVPDYNMMGFSPEQIIGHDLPLKLLRILNNPELIEKLYSTDSMAFCLDVYREYAGHIGKKLPNVSQWNYLADLYMDNDTTPGWHFNRTIYDRVASGYEGELAAYKEFIRLRTNLEDGKKWKIPKVDEVHEEVRKLRQVNYYKNDEADLDERIRWRSMWIHFEFTSEKYAVIFPRSSYELSLESIVQNNCLMKYDYIEKHAKSETTILFIRECNNPSKPYVTMEVLDNKIINVFGKNNMLPGVEVFRFLEVYAGEKKIAYDPHYLIAGNLEDGGVTNDLLEYLKDFSKRRKKELCPQEDEVSGNRQITLAECFPDIPDLDTEDLGVPDMDIPEDPENEFDLFADEHGELPVH